MEGISNTTRDVGFAPARDYPGRNDGVTAGQFAPSLLSVGAEAAGIRGMAYERRDAVRHLADRAASLVTKLGGSFPCPAPEKDPALNSREPQSAIEAALREVQSINEPLRQTDASLQFLSMSLDALERAIG